MKSIIDIINLWSGRIFDVAWPILWQSSLLIAVLFVLDLALQRRVRASVRYALWLVVLLKLLLPPSLALPTSLAWWIRPRAHETQPLPQPERTFHVTYSETPVQLPPLIAPAPIPPPRLSAQSWTVAVAALGSIGLVAFLLSRWRNITAELCRTERGPNWLENLFVRVCDEFGVKRTIRLRLTATAMSPAVCGLFRPTILLPRALIDRLNEKQLCPVLLHELIHLRRGDVWANCAQALLQIIYWWHPLLWLANARIRRLREEAVDDSVMVALRDERDNYARTLLEVAKLAFSRPLASLGLVGILESHNALRKRIERLVIFRTPRRAGLTLASILGIVAFAAMALPMSESPNTLPAINRAESAQRIDPKLFAAAEPTVSEQSEDRPETGSQSVSSELPDAWLAFDETKSTNIPPGALQAQFVFSVTNVSQSDVTITSVVTSCGCTVAKLPAIPWVLSPNHSGEIPVAMDLRGKSGSLTKTVTLKSDKGTKTLTVTAIIPPDLVQDGRLLYEMGKLEEADEKLKDALKADPDNKAAVRTSDARRDIVAKLGQIRFDRVFYDRLPLDELVRRLTEETKKRDPQGTGINFVINPNSERVQMDPMTGLVTNSTAPSFDVAAVQITIKPEMTGVRLADVLDAAVKTADKPIKYSIEDFAVVFSAASGQPVEPLYTRTFRVDANGFYRALRERAGLQEDVKFTNLWPAIRTLFTSVGVDLRPPKSIFYGDRKGTLLVRATLKELDAIQKVLQQLNYAPPQINIKTRMIALPEAVAQSLLAEFTVTNLITDSGFSGLLAPSQADRLLKRCAASPGANLLTTPDVTTLSERQAQVQVVDIHSVVTGIRPEALTPPGITTTNIDPIAAVYQTEAMYFGPVIDLFPRLTGDGYMIQLTVTSSVTGFLGYDPPTNSMTVHVNGKQQDVAVPVPRFRSQKITGNAAVLDGQTLLLARSFLDEERLKDKVPVLGDIPGIGRLFRSERKYTAKKTMFVFVTPTLIDPAGNRLHTDEEILLARNGVRSKSK
jgi:beta-lactamase regulating signal transducer with metallopeptidase domain